MGDGLKFGLVSQWFAPEPGGGVVPSVLARGLAERGHDVRVLTGFPNYPTGHIYPGFKQRVHHVEMPFHGVNVQRVPLLPSHNDRPVQRIANYGSFAASGMVFGTKALADRDALWVYNSPATVGPLVNVIRKRHGVPFLLHIMDVWPDSVLDSGMVRPGPVSQMVERTLTALVRRAYEGASQIAVTSPGQLDLLVARGVPAERLHYVPLWADEKVFFPRPADPTVLDVGLRSAPLIVMYAGAMGHVQGLDTAIRAAAMAAASGIQLVLVGSGLAEDDLKRLTMDLGAENVKFLGRVPADEMGKMSAAADIHLVSIADTPLLRVTMPSKLSSIFAMGKPVIATAAGDVAAVVRDSHAGLVIPQGNVKELAAAFTGLAQGSREQLETWGRSGRVFYERVFAQARGINRVEELLTLVARQGR